MTIATASQRTSRLPGDADGEQDGGHGDRQEEQDAVDDPPAHRAEDPLAEPERDADDEQEDGEDDEDEGERPEGDDPADLAGDGRRLGLGQVDVGQDERHRRVAGRADLGAQARRGLAWPAAAGRRGRRCGGGRWGSGRPG